MRHLALAALIAAPASSALAAGPIHLAVAESSVSPDGHATIDLIAFNPAETARDYVPPAALPADLVTSHGDRQTIPLTPTADQPRQIRLMANGFIRLRYEGTVPAGAMSLKIADIPAIALTVPEATPTTAQPSTLAAVDMPTPVAPPPAPPSAGSAWDNPFLANLSVYEPTYFVYGPGTNTAGRIQVSLKYQIFGRRGSWLDGITFAYTQRMFWDLEKDSSPFRDVNYMPELFYLVAPHPIGTSGIALGGRFGGRHESNGRDGDASRSLNTLYVQPEATIPIGDASLTIGPRIWAYVGGRRGNEDVAHYRGNTGLYAAFGTDDGPRLSLTSRLNFGSGKGAVDAVFSYPLTKLWDSGPQFYLIAQGFSGYGEDLLDYNRHQTRARIGFGITR